MSGESERKTISVFVFDAFAEKCFEGNSAAIVLLPYSEMLSREVKQKLAAEMNLSVTAFVSLKSNSGSFEQDTSFKLEWFTPLCEIKLCGHATMASAVLLFLHIGNKSTELNFETVGGVLKGRLLNNNKIGVELPTFDSKPVGNDYSALVKVVVGSLPVQDVVLSNRQLIIRLKDEVYRKDLESIHTNDNELLSATSAVIDVMVTLKAGDKPDCIDSEGQRFDFISRVFAPWIGISEDSVTGSAYSILAPYWSKIMNKNHFYARQCSPRGGNLSVDLLKDKVQISGNAVCVMEGKIKI